MSEVMEGDILGALGAAEEFELLADAQEAVEVINRTCGLVVAGSKAVLIQEAPNEDGDIEPRFLHLDTFRVLYGNKFCEVKARDGKTKWVSWYRVWMAAHQRREFVGLTFAATGKEPPGYYNLWRGFSVEPRPGDYPLFAEHLFVNICHENAALYDWIMGWMAHIVQMMAGTIPMERVGTALVFRGKRGTGKTTIGDIFGGLFKANYRLVDDPRYLVGQFNAHMVSCLLLQADEAVWAGDKASEGRLKGLVTSDRQAVEMKGVDPIWVRNNVHLIMTSNEGWVVPAGPEERRWAVFDVGEGRMQDHSFFGALYAEMDSGGREALLHDLMAFDLSRVNLRAPPATEALFDQKVESLQPIDAWWYDRLSKGTVSDKASDWPGPLISTAELLDSLWEVQDRLGVRRKSLETQLGKAMKDFAPTAIKGKDWFNDRDNNRVRLPCYRNFPDLATARAAFCARMRWGVAWPED